MTFGTTQNKGHVRLQNPIFPVLSVGCSGFHQLKCDKKTTSRPVITCVSNGEKYLAFSASHNTFSISAQYRRDPKVTASIIIYSGKGFRMHQATQVSIFRSKKFKEIPHKCRFLFYHLQHRNNSSSSQYSCISTEENLSGELWLQYWAFVCTIFFSVMVIYLK